MGLGASIAGLDLFVFPALHRAAGSRFKSEPPLYYSSTAPEWLGSPQDASFYLRCVRIITQTGGLGWTVAGNRRHRLLSPQGQQPQTSALALSLPPPSRFSHDNSTSILIIWEWVERRAGRCGGLLQVEALVSFL